MLPLDIFLVTFQRLEEVRTVVNLIYQNTVSPFRLLVADNGRQKEMLDFLHQTAREKGNVVLIQNPDNYYCCRASNQLFSLWDAPYGVYLCSYEAFCLRQGWDLECIDAMESNPTAGLGGYLSWSKYYQTGADYVKHEFFQHFRNPQYIGKHLQRKFTHIQGGAFIIRKAMYDEIGGFNEALTHGYMDVEYSYYVESCGWSLLPIPSILSLHRTTRPNVEAFDLTRYGVVHPLTLDQYQQHTPNTHSGVPKP